MLSSASAVLGAGSSAFVSSPHALRRPRPVASVRVASTTPRAQLSNTSSVRLDIQGRHLEVTPAIREYTEGKIGHALSHFDVSAGSHQAMVRLSARNRERQHGAPLQKVEVTLTTKRGVIRAEVEDQTLYAAVDKAADKLERQLRKIKEREVKGGVHTQHLAANGAARIGSHLPEEPPELDTSRSADLADLPAEVIRRKVFHVEAMSVEEAVANMEDVGHAFFLFRDSKSQDIQVLYRRDAGGYGILVPRQ